MLAILVLSDAFARTRDLSAFYTDQGVLPREVLLTVPHPTLFNFILTVGTTVGAALWFGLLILAATGMLVGWQTRWCTVATWVLHIAVKHRNPLILDVGDLQLGLFLWWAIFLPIGTRYSVDAAGNPQWKDLPNEYRGIAPTGYILQLSLIYLFSAISKTDPVWWDSGLALHYVLQSDIFVTGFGHWLSGQTDLLRSLSKLVVYGEFAIASALLLSARSRLFSLLALLGIFSLHLSIWLSLNLGLIPLISVGCTAALWPGLLWEKTVGRIAWPSLSSACRTETRESNIIRGFLLLICLYIVHLNLAVFNRWIVPYPVKFFGYVFRQQQDWRVFAPHPIVEDGWLIAKAETRGGEIIDLLRRGEPVSEIKPARISEEFSNHRWRLWTLNLTGRKDPPVMKAYCTWLARLWNESHRGAEKVVKIDLVYMAEPTPLPGQRLVANSVVLFEFEVPKELLDNAGEVYWPLAVPDAQDKTN